MDYKEVNEVIGSPYDLTSFSGDNDKFNCNGLIEHLDPTYKEFIKEFQGTDTLKLIKNTKKIINKYYKKVNFEDRAKNDIILVKSKGDRAFNHVCMLLDKHYFVHTEDTKFGAKVEPISLLKFQNKDFIILRKR